MCGARWGMLSKREKVTGRVSHRQNSKITSDAGLLTTLREKLTKIGAKVVRHDRYITFQMAEVAIPRPLFAEVLRLIDGLRPRPAPT